MREAARRWASAQLERSPEVLRAGYFGSYATGCEGAGSDLDLIVVLSRCDEPLERRALRFRFEGIPVPCDLLVYTEAELDAVLARGGRFAEELTARCVWFGRPTQSR